MEEQKTCAWEECCERCICERCISSEHSSQFDPVRLEEETQDIVRQLKREESNRELAAHPSLRTIPRLFIKPTISSAPLRRVLYASARRRFLYRKSLELLDISGMEEIYRQLVVQATPPVKRNFERVNYDAFFNVADSLIRAGVITELQASEFFSASIFMRFRRDRIGRIGVGPFFNYIMRKVSLCQQRIALTIHDGDGDGYLEEADVERYIMESVERIPQMNEEEMVSFRQYYVIIAMRKFFFFLDPHRAGRIQVQDVLCSDVLTELLEIQHATLSPNEQSQNWFSKDSALRVYVQFLQLDKDQKGVLSKKDMMMYGGNVLTEAFVERLFDEYAVGDGIDFHAFVEFILAMENKSHYVALQYFWRILDVNHKGGLTIFSVNYFFKDVLKRMEMAGHDPVRVEDVKDEIFDMVKPSNPLCITLEDIVRSNVGDTVVTILTDFRGFWAYDNRESLLVEGEEEMSPGKEEEEPDGYHSA